MFNNMLSSGGLMHNNKLPDDAILPITRGALHWRPNDHNCISNHHRIDWLLKRLFGRSSKKTSKLRVSGLCVGNSPGPVNSPHKWPVTRKMFPFDDVIMVCSTGWLPTTVRDSNPTIRRQRGCHRWRHSASSDLRSLLLRDEMQSISKDVGQIEISWVYIQ